MRVTLIRVKVRVQVRFRFRVRVRVLSVAITEPPTALSSSTAEGSHEGLMALQA